MWSMVATPFNSFPLHNRCSIFPGSVEAGKGLVMLRWSVRTRTVGDAFLVAILLREVPVKKQGIADMDCQIRDGYKHNTSLTDMVINNNSLIGMDSNRNFLVDVQITRHGLLIGLDIK